MINQTFPCGICHKNVKETDKGILRSNCNKWIHIKCNNTSTLEYLKLVEETDDVSWFCKPCHTIMFPFGSMENEELSNLFSFDVPSFIDFAPSFEITSDLLNLPNLDDYDIDEHLPASINSSYHTLQEISNFNSSENDLALIHMNIRSLSFHFDELVSTLACLKLNFDVIGVSETWDSFENPIKMNVEIPGFCYFSSQSHTQNGGVALYIKSSLTPIPRPDLGKNSTDYESVWVEIENRNGKNYLFCYVYRHPSSNIDIFCDYLQEVLSNSAICNKQVFILGDFNINLLNHNFDTPTTNFVNFFFSKQFLPYIAHPSRVSDNSSTLIDNIFANISDQETVSGNILT